MKIKKAVFAVAGFGVYFLTTTQGLQKELLVIVDNPVIKYGLEEVITVDIDTVIFAGENNEITA